MKAEVIKLIQQITYRKAKTEALTPNSTAILMFDTFEKIVTNTEWKDAAMLKKNLKQVAEILIEKDKMNFVVRNCSERMLHILNQSCLSLKIELNEN